MKRSKPKDVFGLFNNPDASKHDNRVFAIATEAGVLLFSNTPKGKRHKVVICKALRTAFSILQKYKKHYESTR